MSLPSLDIDLSLLADEVCESSSNTLNGSKGIRNLSLTIDVGVEDTKNVLEFSSLFVDETLRTLG